MFLLKHIKYKNILGIDELSIPEGKVTCIIGESGSGKTTLLRLLNNLISCDEGSIFYNKTNINELNPVEYRRKVVMLGQSPAIFSGNIRDNLLIGLKFSEKPIVEDEVLLEFLNMVYLSKSLEDNPEKLSGGEKQRLALARILLLEPEVLLLDEPSSSLDEQSAGIVVDNIVKYVKSNKKTLIMVTHSKETAKNHAENIIEVGRGKILNEGGPSIG